MYFSGKTLPGVILDIGRKERNVGLTYSGLSRVKSLNQLAFESAPPDTMPSFERMTGYYNYAYMKEVQKEHQRLKVLEQKTMEEYQMNVMMREMDLEPQIENNIEQQQPQEGPESAVNQSLANLQLMDIDRIEQQQQNVEDMEIDKSD